MVKVTALCCPGPGDHSPALSPCSCTKLCSIAQRPRRLPITWPTSSAPVDDRTVCLCAQCLFYKALTDFDLNWWWRGGREGDLFFLDRKPVLSCAFLILLAQPELSSCAVCGTSCWTVSLLMSTSNSRVYSSSVEPETKIFCSKDITPSLFLFYPTGRVMMKETNDMGSGCCTWTPRK